LERKGVSSKLVAEAKTLLAAGPEQAVGIMGGDKMQWLVPKDRTVMDNARLLAIDLLEKLSKL
jgi:hypothetical protein